MIKWSKNYLMGIDKLDEEHKELFRISDQIYNKVMERGDDAKYRLFLMKETLEYMLRYFKRHAKSEEIYMREIGYAGYEFHKMLHDEFYNMLLKKKADIVKRNECSKKEILELVGDGIGWLLEHIITEDMAIVGKGISAISSYNSDFEEQLKNVINTNLISFLNVAANVKIIMMLSRLVDTFFSRISPTMQLPPKHHSIAYVLPWAEGLHWQSRSSGCSNS